MVKYSIIEKLNVLLTIIKSSPFFLTCFIVGTFLLSFVILDYKTTKKIRNKFLIFALILTLGFIFYKYYNYLISLSDNLIEEIFMAIYFPNLAVYTIVIVSTNICLFISLLKKKLNNEYKVANIFSTILLDFLFILILETIIKNKIDVYETLTVYSNKELLILIELSTAIYTAWLLVVGFMKLVDKTIRKEIVEVKKPLPVYEAPVYNSYEVNTVNNSSVFVNNDYTSVFSIEPTNFLDKEEPEAIETEIKQHQEVLIEEKLPEVSHIEETKLEVETTNTLKDEVTTTIKSEENKSFGKLFGNSFFNHKKEEKETPEYRVPLFETLDDDAIMNCIVPIQKEKIVPIVKNPEITIEIDGKALLEKFNRGEKLDVEQYKMLKEYIIKQGI